MSYLIHVCICFNLGVVLVISCSYFECVYACVSLLKGYDSLVLFKVRRRGAHLLSFESIDGYATTFVAHGQCDARPTGYLCGCRAANLWLVPSYTAWWQKHCEWDWPRFLVWIQTKWKTDFQIYLYMQIIDIDVKYILLFVVGEIFCIVDICCCYWSFISYG